MTDVIACDHDLVVRRVRHIPTKLATTASEMAVGSGTAATALPAEGAVAAPKLAFQSSSCPLV
ncbi:hypothetical protein [Lacipirellula parvula]|nr:hypothetical protein [Lacipirellula parvula]